MTVDKDQLRVVVQNARSFERELRIAKLEAELLNEDEGDEKEREYRRGWNDRARAMVREMRSGG